MNSAKNTAALVGSLLLGAVVGGAIALLYAPIKGSKTRKKLMRKGEDLADEMKDKANEFINTIKKEAEDAKGKVKEYMENGMATSNKAK